jgi:ABC-2 type transport system ATP-binding protein
VLRNKFWDHFRHLQSEGHTLFVTTQYVGEAAYCDYVGVMSDGRLLMVEKPEELRRRALGGDVIVVKTDRLLNFSELSELRGQNFVRNRQASLNRDLSLEVVVEEAATAMPAIFSWLEDRGLTVESATEYNPPFDDVFVMLLEKEAAREKAEVGQEVGQEVSHA